MTAAATVDQFLAAVTASDLDAALELCADDVVYDNVPMGAVEGHQGIRDVLAGFLGSATQIEWVVFRQIADDTTVLNERLDRFEIGGKWLELPVAGVFEVADGKITLWRDYFDAKTLTDQMG